jgi:hypothetical protein
MKNARGVRTKARRLGMMEDKIAEPTEVLKLIL